MSIKYNSGSEVPIEVLCKRIEELVCVITHGRRKLNNEFSMRVPAECDRDADIVLSEAVRRLREQPKQPCPTAKQEEYRVYVCKNCELALSETAFKDSNFGVCPNCHIEDLTDFEKREIKR